MNTNGQVDLKSVHLVKNMYDEPITSNRYLQSLTNVTLEAQSDPEREKGFIVLSRGHVVLGRNLRAESELRVYPL